MNCLKKEELVLLYYGECNERQTKLFRNHTKECISCRQAFAEIEVTCSQLKEEPPCLESGEVEEVLARVQREAKTPQTASVIKEKLSEFSENIKIALTYKPQLVPVAVVVMVMLLILPFLGRERGAIEREFDILEIEMELSLESVEGSLFELYEEQLNATDQRSHHKRSTPRMKLEEDRSKTLKAAT